MKEMKEGEIINLLQMVDEGFVPHRWMYDKKTKEGRYVEERRDRMDFFSSMSDGALTITMIHPDGRILHYGLLHAGRPPGYISSNYMETIPLRIGVTIVCQ